MIIFFILTRDMLQKAVKLETSILAKNRKDKDNNERLDLVMDDEFANDIMFKRLMQDGHAEVIQNLSVNFLMDTPTDLQDVMTEFPDFSQDRDFCLFLNVSNNWSTQYRKSTDIKLQQYMIDYISYRWLENKSPDDASAYYSRLNKTIDDIQSLLVRTTVPLKRTPTPYP